MYEQFFDLKERPFDLTPNPKYLFLTPSHREALSNLDYGITAGTSVTVLIGDAGTGKTTVIKATLESSRRGETHAVYLNNPTLTRSEFLEFLAREFSLGADVAASKTRLLERLEEALKRSHAAGVTTALIVDEAFRTSSSRRSGCSRMWRRPRSSCCRLCWQVSRSWPIASTIRH